MAACRTGDRDEHKGGPVSRRDCDCHSRVNFKQPGNILWSVEADGVTCFVSRDHTGQQCLYLFRGRAGAEIGSRDANQGLEVQTPRPLPKPAAEWRRWLILQLS